MTETNRCPLCGLAVLDVEQYETRNTSEGPKRVHDRCVGQQTRRNDRG